MTDQALRYQKEKEALKQAFEEKGDPAQYLTCHTRLLESLIDERAKSLHLPEDVALLAAGGFGVPKFSPSPISTYLFSYPSTIRSSPPNA